MRDDQLGLHGKKLGVSFSSAMRVERAFANQEAQAERRPYKTS